MRITFKRFILIFLIPVILVGGFFILKNFLPHPPYPPLDKQRAALKNKPVVTPVRLLDSVQIIDDRAFLCLFGLIQQIIQMGKLYFKSRTGK